ncbi:MAG: helix-turn-helix domain-containing protein [Gemmatimonadales bacterium]
MPPEVDRVLHDLRALHLLGQEEIARVLPEIEHARARLWLVVMMPTATPLPHPTEAAGVLLTVKEVAAQLRFSTGHVYELVHSGRLRSIRDGKAIRITREALAEWRTAHEADQLDGTLRGSGEFLVHDEPGANAHRPPLRPDRARGRRGQRLMKRSC